MHVLLDQLLFHPVRVNSDNHTLLQAVHLHQTEENMDIQDKTQETSLMLKHSLFMFIILTKMLHAFS
jgi:hypothetical protein